MRGKKTFKKFFKILKEINSALFGLGNRVIFTIGFEPYK